MTTQSAYAVDGVNVTAGDSFSAFAGEICRQTYGNSPFVEVRDYANGFFRGPKGFQLKNLPGDALLDLAPDGIGTKTILIDTADAHAGASRNVMAMCSGDILRWGGLPLVFVNILDVATLGETDSSTNRAYRRMIKGMAIAAKEIGVVCYRGETAELGACVGSENPSAATKFNWAGCMLGAYLPDRIITGETLATGQLIVALEEPTFRSNGISSVRGALRVRFGEKWWENPEARKVIRTAARPATLYDRFLTSANGWTHPISKPRFGFHAISHITGGGVVGKFAEDILFRRGLSAIIEPSKPSCAMQEIVHWRGMDEKECYRSFSCGIGMIVVLDPDDAYPFVALAEHFNIRARVCGEIVSSISPRLDIKSGFSKRQLVYTPE